MSRLFIILKYLAFTALTAVSMLLSINMFANLSSEPQESLLLSIISLSMEFLKIFQLVKGNTLWKLQLKKQAIKAWGLAFILTVLSIFASYGYNLVIINRGIETASNSDIQLQIDSNRMEEALLGEQVDLLTEQIAGATQRQKDTPFDYITAWKQITAQINELSGTKGEFVTSQMALNKEYTRLTIALNKAKAESNVTSNMFDLMAVSFHIDVNLLMLILLLTISILIEIGIISSSPAIPIDKKHLHHLLDEFASSADFDKVAGTLHESSDEEIMEPVSHGESFEEVSDGFIPVREIKSPALTSVDVDKIRDAIREVNAEKKKKKSYYKPKVKKAIEIEKDTMEDITETPVAVSSFVPLASSETILDVAKTAEDSLMEVATKEMKDAIAFSEADNKEMKEVFSDENLQAAAKLADESIANDLVKGETIVSEEKPVDAKPAVSKDKVEPADEKVEVETVVEKAIPKRAPKRKRVPKKKSDVSVEPVEEVRAPEPKVSTRRTNNSKKPVVEKVVEEIPVAETVVEPVVTHARDISSGPSISTEKKATEKVADVKIYRFGKTTEKIKDQFIAYVEALFKGHVDGKELVNSTEAAKKSKTNIETSDAFFKRLTSMTGHSGRKLLEMKANNVYPNYTKEYIIEYSTEEINEN